MSNIKLDNDYLKQIEQEIDKLKSQCDKEDIDNSDNMLFDNYISESDDCLTDEELYAYCDYWINEANQIKKMCEEKGYLFFDTSFNQEKVIKGIFKKIKKSKSKNLK